MGMEVSFLPCPLRNAPAGPDKSGHRPPCGILVKSALRVCPDLRGTLRPPVRGHGRKDTSMPMRLAKANYFASSKGQIRFQRAAKLLQGEAREFIVITSNIRVGERRTLE
jgi:hypothetical protein